MALFTHKKNSDNAIQSKFSDKLVESNGVERLDFLPVRGFVEEKYDKRIYSYSCLLYFVPFKPIKKSHGNT